MLKGNPFSGTDFSTIHPGPPAAPPAGPPQPQDYSWERLGVEGAPAPYQDDAGTQLARAQQEYDRLVKSPEYQKQSFGGEAYETGDLDRNYELAVSKALSDLTFWRTRRLTEIDREEAEAKQAVKDAERREDSAAARANSAYIARLREEAANLRAETGREFDLDERLAGQKFTAGEREASQAFLMDKQRQQQEFDAGENAAGRMLRQLEIDVAAGRINMEAALGTLSNFLQAQQYTLPSGAEYVPGFQPGGAVQEASRLAGVGYNPANYRANTVPFDPAAVVRQTMGR